MTLLEPEEPRTVVTAAAAPLWTSVEAAQEFASFESSSYAAYRDWVRHLLTVLPSFKGRLDTVALSGEPVRVLGPSGDQLVRVELPAQPDGSSGYIGHMSAEHVGVDMRRRATHVVATRDLPAVTDGPDAGSTELSAGMTVELLAERGERNQARVLLASGAIALIAEDGLRPLDSPAPPCELFEIATGFLAVPYVWGGTDGAGIDCSGLVHMAARIGGLTVPRDAHLQWADTRIKAGWDDLELGDLLFFGASASLQGIDHVGLYAGEGRMLHAPEEGRSVTLEPISGNARAKAVGFGRFPLHRRDRRCC